MNLPETAPALPWIRNQDELPGLLPTTIQIEAASTELPNNFNTGLRRTVLINEMFVVKYGPKVYENEGYAMLLLERVKKAPAPRLYAMYREKKKLYIIMEYMPGQQLSTIWPSLSEDEKSPIIHQLQQAFNGLRELQSPACFSGVSGGPFTHRYFFSREGDPSVTGPFTTEKEFCNALVLRSKKNWESYGKRPWMTEFFERHLSEVLQGHSSIFTHSDLQRKNILVKEERSSSKDTDRQTRRSFKVVAILDWEYAGWYPSYWEYAACFTWFDWSDDWPEKVERILHPYPMEASMLRMVGQDLDNY